MKLKVILWVILIGIASGYAGLRIAQSDGLPARQAGVETVPASLPPLTFESNRRISDYEAAHYWTHTFSSGGHSMAVWGDTLYAVWYDVRNGNADVFFARSVDGGRTFGPNKRVNDDTTTSVQYKPGIGVDAQGTIYVAWRDGRKGNADIFFARSTDGGKTFSKNLQLNDDRGAAYQGNPTLAVNSKGWAVVAWTDARNGKDDIYMTVSKDQGRTFSTNRRVNDDPEATDHSHPSVAVDAQGVIYAAWEDFRNDNFDIYFTKSFDGGATFSANRRVNDDPPSAGGSAPQISPSLALGPSGEIVVAWSDFRNSAVTMPPHPSATGEEQHWEAARTGNADIYFARSTDGGATFSANLRLNDDPGTAAQAFPSATANAQGVVAVAWEDFRNGDADIYLAKSPDGGKTFGPNRRVNDDAGKADQYHPSVTLDPNGRAYLIWTDERNNRFASRGLGGDDEGDDVYFARSN
ncbi:MAG: exo-alpha-sialidase [Nitrospirae bacterium]|nr:exo-alpha-sialidase [Nitrospirota bacterium]